MPINNPLYAFINAQLAKGQTEINLYGYIITKKKDLYDSNYFLVELNIQGDIRTIKTSSGKNTEKFHQTSSIHISIFEQFNDIGFKSYYHITMQFIDKNTLQPGINAHFYFDKYHQLINNPTFKDLDTTKGAAGALPVKAEYPCFTHLALYFALPAIKRLMLQHQLRVDNLSKDYQQARDKAVDHMFDNPTAPDNNLELLENAIFILQQWVDLDGTKHQKQLKHLQACRKKISEASAAIITPEHSALKIDNARVDVTIEDNNESASTTNIMDVSNTKAPALEKENKKFSEFEMCYQKAYQYKQRSDCSLSHEEMCELAKNWNEINNRVFARANYIIETYDMVDMPADLLKKVSFGVDVLLSDYDAFCIKTLECLLTNKQLELAEQFKHWTIALPETILENALGCAHDDEANNKLIQFILTHGATRYPINTSLIHFNKGKAPASPLCIAFYLNKPNCFQMLLEHCHADVLVMGNDGLPLAHTILQKPAYDRFRQILIMTISGIDNNFFKKLIILIKIKMQEEGISASDEAEYLNVISSYETLAKQKNAGVALTSRERQVLIPAATTMVELLSKRTLEEINASTSYLQVKNRIQRQTKKMAELSKQLRNRFYETAVKKSITAIIDGVSEIKASEELKLALSLLTFNDCYKEITRNELLIDKIVAALELKKKLGMQGNVKKIDLNNERQRSDYEQLKQYDGEIKELSGPSEKMLLLLEKALLRIREKSDANYLRKCCEAFATMKASEDAYLLAKITNINRGRASEELKSAIHTSFLLTSDKYWSYDKNTQEMTVYTVITRINKDMTQQANKGLPLGDIAPKPQAEELEDEYADVDFVKASLS